MTPSSTRVLTRAWSMLALGVVSHAGTTFLITVPAYLIPLLQVQEGIPLVAAGALASAPSIGMCLTLVAWGAVADRFGERWAISACVTACALGAFAVLLAGSHAGFAVVLVACGAAAGGTNSASGRLVVAWFPKARRGLAMGIRQMSVPLGLAVAAVVVPPLAERTGVTGPFVLIGAVLVVLGLVCALAIRDRPPEEPADTRAVLPPPTPATNRVSPSAAEAPRTGAPDEEGTSGAVGTSRVGTNPYRRSSFLVRIHVVSALLVIPQYTMATFAFVFLVSGQGWETGPAGVMVAVAQMGGAVGRVVIGGVSDAAGSRVRVIRAVALTTTIVFGCLAVAGWLGAVVLTGIVLVAAVTASTADNGLEFTAIAESAGPRWSGRALGMQNTGQFLVSAGVGPAVGALVSLAGYAAAFACVAAVPLVALGVLPRHDESTD
ncbi:MFS transporter [Brevibacterium litoralis]|uniref:MFS transporter n=1 Tax=Brevibacterium litoralis TaxID=3138935 RepID=UPI0032ECB360